MTDTGELAKPSAKQTISRRTFLKGIAGVVGGMIAAETGVLILGKLEGPSETKKDSYNKAVIRNFLDEIANDRLLSEASAFDATVYGIAKGDVEGPYTLFFIQKDPRGPDYLVISDKLKYTPRDIVSHQEREGWYDFYKGKKRFVSVSDAVRYSKNLTARHEEVYDFVAVGGGVFWHEEGFAKVLEGLGVKNDIDTISQTIFESTGLKGLGKLDVKKSMFGISFTNNSAERDFEAGYGITLFITSDLGDNILVNIDGRAEAENIAGPTVSLGSLPPTVTIPNPILTEVSLNQLSGLDERLGKYANDLLKKIAP